MAIFPPMVPNFSTRKTFFPAPAISRETWMPPTPPPMTSVSGWTVFSLGAAASPKGTPWTAQFTTAFARSVEPEPPAPFPTNDARTTFSGSPPARARPRVNAGLK
jgi:hypothetical protein